MAYEPGTHFKYSNGDATVLGQVLENVCAMKVEKYAEQFVFTALDIADYLWTHYPDGTLETDGGLALCSRDLARIGQLLLQNGTWKDKQLTSASWIQQSTTGVMRLTQKRSFGYYWNEMEFDLNTVREKAIFAPGDGGQFLAIFPALDMVVMITAGNYDKDPTSMCWDVVQNEIVTVVVDRDLSC